jgi:hypothetical protein
MINENESRGTVLVHEKGAPGSSGGLFFEGKLTFRVV